MVIVFQKDRPGFHILEIHLPSSVFLCKNHGSGLFVSVDEPLGIIIGTRKDHGVDMGGENAIHNNYDICSFRTDRYHVVRHLKIVIITEDHAVFLPLCANMKRKYF